MMKEFIRLEEIIKSKAGGETVYFLANRGNFGDGLIRFGEIKFFNQTGINFKELTTRNKIDWMLPAVKHGTLIYGGGGAWCKLWDHSIDILQKVEKYFKNIIVLPSTYEKNYSLSKATFFRRDNYQSQENMPEAIFCHDMAFFIGNIKSQAGTGKGYFFREDNESADKNNLPMNNIDLGSKGNHYSDVYPFFEVISNFAEIHTDRLHVAIASCLMEKEVHLYSGAYFKQKAVYLSSIREFFNNVHFHDRQK